MSNLNVTANANWTGGLKGHGTIKSDYLNSNIAIPAGLGGSGNGAHPKEVLISSATTCYTAVLAYLLDTKKVPVAEITVKSDATIAGDAYTITHYPEVILAADATEEHATAARELTDEADKNCDVGNLLKKAGATITVEAKVSKR